MRKNRASASNLFLMELIFAILFFALASAICVQIFVKAHTLTLHTSAMNQAINYASSVAETFGSCESMDEAYDSLAIIYPEANINKINGIIKVPFASDSKDYVMRVSFKEDSMNGTCHIKIYPKENRKDVIYKLTVENHFQRGTVR